MNKWIKHDGKGMPVDGDTLVSVEFRSGFCDTDLAPSHASFWYPNEYDSRNYWCHEKGDIANDIVAYLIVEDNT